MTNPAVPAPAGTAVSQRKGAAVALASDLDEQHDAVRDVIDSALVRLKRDGTLDQLYLRWFPVSFY